MIKQNKLFFFLTHNDQLSIQKGVTEKIIKEAEEKFKELMGSLSACEKRIAGGMAKDEKDESSAEKELRENQARAQALIEESRLLRVKRKEGDAKHTKILQKMRAETSEICGKASEICKRAFKVGESQDEKIKKIDSELEKIKKESEKEYKENAKKFEENAKKFDAIHQFMEKFEKDPRFMADTRSKKTDSRVPAPEPVPVSSGLPPESASERRADEKEPGSKA